MKLPLLTALAFGMGFGVSHADEDADRELAKLAGAWGIKAAQESGLKSPNDFLPSPRVVFKGSRFSATFGPVILLEGHVTVDPSKTPKAIDFQGTAGRHSGKTCLGIYEVKGEVLKLCFARPGSERPRDFSSTAANRTYSFDCDRPKAKWWAEWHYDRDNVVAPPSSPGLFVRSCATTDDIEKVTRYYEGVVGRNGTVKFTLTDGKSEVGMDSDSKFQGPLGVTKVTIGAEQAKVQAQAFDAKIVSEVHAFITATYDETRKGGARRPAAVRVLTLDVKEYTATVVISQGKDEKHTHVVATFVIR
jgi:uncharacterized protein (TIGR03067 family)